MRDKEEGLRKIKQLVTRFEEQIAGYKKYTYNEMQTRADFIDPFFEALGWDIHNTQGYAESYREVIQEDKVKVDKATKSPDYSFRLGGGNRLFFVEAKKPSVLIKEDDSPAYQLRRYGWSAKLNISILSNFCEFSLYDCTKKPYESDKSSVARVHYLTYKEYEKEWDFLWDTFSKEGVLKGGLDKYNVSSANKRGTSTVDKEFLNSLDEWRTLLAESLSKDNKQLKEEELNFIVQHTLDRIIFLRICEDRGIEDYESLKKTLTGEHYYNELIYKFNEADAKYNSGLFDFEKDTLSQTITIPNKILKNIISGLYYPECPYEFSVLSVEILGSAYEQFLGKTITINTKGKAVIELKPEVRKAGGVYYTPQYIVDYIIENTVGELCNNKKPKDIEKLKIVDPACGSGSFLLGAYQYLLNWHRNYYLENPNKKNPLTPDKNLTTEEKKRILLNNIYGVDIDINAVEVTKLSLLLKCMEGETQASITHQRTIFKARVLPTLDANIKSGNSLIDTDYYDNEIDFGEERKIKPFSWEKTFPEVFKQGGFDAVVGNPPWVDLKGHPPNLINYYFMKFKTTTNRINLYSIFLEQGLNIITKNGYLGFVIPNSLLYQSSYEKIRKIILENWKIDKIVRLPDKAFSVKAETMIITINTLVQKTTCLLYNRKAIVHKISEKTALDTKRIQSKIWIKNEKNIFDIFNTKQERILLLKIKNNKNKLLDICDFTLGITPYDKYVGHTEEQINDRVFHASFKKDETFKPLLLGEDLNRYFLEWGQKEFISYGEWLGAPRQQKFFIQPRILIRQIISGVPPRIYATYTVEEFYNTQSIFNILLKDNNYNLNLKYILGIINSNLINFYHSHTYLDISKKLFQKILIQNCKKFPIKIINFSNKQEAQAHDQIVKSVDQLLQFNKDLHVATLQTQKEQIQTKIEYHEDKINTLVYQLYDLTEEDIKIVEGKE